MASADEVAEHGAPVVPARWTLTPEGMACDGLHAIDGVHVGLDESGTSLLVGSTNTDAHDVVDVTKGDVLLDRLTHILTAKEALPDTISLRELAEDLEDLRPPVNGDDFAQAAAPRGEVNALLGRQRPETDLGNAERLADRGKQRLRWAYGLGWLFWDGRRWQRDQSNRVIREATTAVRAIYGEAAELQAAASRTTDEGDRSRLSRRADETAKWARASESRNKIEAMVKLAGSQPRLVIEDGPAALDADPLVLNVQNGVLDLKTFELHAHAPDRLLTKVATAAYDAGASAPHWEQFVAMILPDPAVREYVQMAVGYSILGSYSEFLFLAHGSGANGKSTFLNALRDVLGDYADEAPSDLLVQRREWGASAESALAGLRGSRLVTTVETEQGKRMAEVLVKQLTGEAEIKAKFMRQDYFTYTNTSAVWMATNHRPWVEGADYAIWRRIRLIPFEVTIPEAERKEPEEVRELLRGERDGILRWLIDGLRLYEQRGRKLTTPEAIERATGEYRCKMDPLGDWLEDKVVIELNGWEKVGDVRRSYEDHCDATGRMKLGANKFNERLEELGCTRTRASVEGRQQRFWRGLRLVERPFAA